MVRGARRSTLSRCPRVVGALVVADRQVALPSGVGGVGGGQPLADTQRGLVLAGGGGQVPRPPGEGAEAFVADRQVGAPIGGGGGWVGHPLVRAQRGLVLTGS